MEDFWDKITTTSSSSTTFSFIVFIQVFMVSTASKKFGLEVFWSLDSLRSLQLASISDLILNRWISFFCVLSCHTEERKWAIVQTIEKLRSSWWSKLRVMMVPGVMSGILFCKPSSNVVPATLLLTQSNKACCNVSTNWPLSWHWLQWGDWFGSILANLSAVGRILWSIMNKKLVRVAPACAALPCSMSCPTGW